MCKPVWTFILCFFLLFVILFLRIYAPDILLVFSAAQDVVHGLEGSGHGVIHIVVSVLAVSADAVEILKCIEVFNQLVHPVIGVEISGVSLLHPLTVAVEDLGILIDNAHADKLGDRLIDAGFFVHAPEVVALVAEILKADPHGMLRILDKVGRPVVEYLNSAEL